MTLLEARSARQQPHLEEYVAILPPRKEVTSGSASRDGGARGPAARSARCVFPRIPTLVLSLFTITMQQQCSNMN